MHLPWLQHFFNTFVRLGKMILKAIHILIALNLLLSTTGVSVFNHVCKKRGVFTGLFHIPDSCCSKKQKTKEREVYHPTSSEDSTNTPSLKKMPCCVDLFSYCKAEIFSNESGTAIYNASQSDIVAIEYQPFLDKPISLSNHKNLCFSLYENPPPDREIYLLVQSFLC